MDNQFCFLVPSNLLYPEYDGLQVCNLDSVPTCWGKEEFQLERQRLQNFIAGSERQEDIMDNGRTSWTSTIYSTVQTRYLCSKYSLMLRIFWRLKSALPHGSGRVRVRRPRIRVPGFTRKAQDFSRFWSKNFFYFCMFSKLLVMMKQLQTALWHVKTVFYWSL